MQQSYIIGRSGEQPFEIKDDLRYVHGQHARLTVDTNSREWFIEDLKGNAGNGVYVRDDAGNFRRVMACRIRPTDVIRLGPENAQSFTFMAHHVLTPDNYNFEFGYVRNLDKKLRQEEEAHVAKVKKHNVISGVAGLGAAILTLIIRAFVEIDFTLLIGITTVTTAAVGAIVKLSFRNDNEGLKEIKARRARLIQCPKCWRPLSDYDMRNSRCSACKAM